MDRKQLRTLLAVAEHRSFSAAAVALGTVQSNVSAHVSRLEDELGVTLIDRATTEPTEEGLVVLERARRIEGEFDSLSSDLAYLRDVVVGTVRLGVIGTTARWLVPPLLKAAWNEYPEVRVIVLDAPSSVLVTGITTGAIDLGVVNLPIEHPDIRVDPLFTEDRILIAPEGHPLHGRSEVSLEELAEHDLLLEAPGTAFRDVLDTAAAEAGVQLRARAEFDGMRLLASLAFAGFGAGVVPASAIPTDLGGAWRAIPVVGVPRRKVGLISAHRAMPSAAARMIGQLVTRVVAERDSREPTITADVTTPESPAARG
ncbi:MAG: LysR family transcriptional regulator [Microthrixaceae bacterium]|nr:LysR family transcriptional regulator [Microthrixaceae bacterium]